MVDLYFKSLSREECYALECSNYEVFNLMEDIRCLMDDVNEARQAEQDAGRELNQLKAAVVKYKYSKTTKDQLALFGLVED